MTVVLSVENLSKRYQLGTLGSGTASEDLRRWFCRRILRREQDDAPLVVPNFETNREGNTLWALRDVTFSVNQGEVVGIIGKNGAGKSTLLKILSQITAPSAGVARVKGRLASLLEVGTGFNGELTGRENVFLNGSILGMTPREIRARFDDIIAFAEIKDFVDTPVKRYSSGMFVRLAFAVAAHLQTEIMVIDEVLAVGDIGFQKKCLGKMSEASATGRTILFVSHRMDHISALCPRSLVLNAGQLVFDGPTDQALGRYYQMFTTGGGGDLSSRADRSGRGRVRIADLWIEGPDGLPVETLVTGRPAVFKLRIRNMMGEPVRELNVGVAIFTLNNMFTASLSTQEGGVFSFDLNGPEAVISLRIDRLPFNSGQFYLNCVVRAASGAYELDDLIEHAKTFSIDYGDYHGIGQSSGGFVSLGHSARIDEGTFDIAGCTTGASA